DFSSAFTARLAGMAKTHELLNQSSWAGTDLRSLVEIMVRPYVSADRANFAITGPNLLLTPNAAATMGMVFYELATNAAKYGAWSEREGVVNLSWHILAGGDDDNVSISWMESGTQHDAASRPEGFGTGLIRRIVEYELGGRVELEPAPSG